MPEDLPGADKGMPPFIFAFVPVWWDEEFKGKERTVEDGPNYRWQFVIQYPQGVSAEQGDALVLSRHDSGIRRHAGGNQNSIKQNSQEYK